MAVYKRGGVWWFSFIYASKRIQESAKTSRKTVALEAERAKRLMLERALAGLPTEARERRIRSAAEVLYCYADSYGLNHRTRSTVWVKGCVVHLKRHLGSLLLLDLTGQVDLTQRVITVGRAKTSSGTGRQIPMNQELSEILSLHAAWFTKRFTDTSATDYLFPWGSPFPTDPTRPTTTIKTAWENLRVKAGVSCRLHDLRHTAATKMAEAGVPESTMLSLMGHMSRAMLERYSHIRMTAKREAVESLSVRPKLTKTEAVSTLSTTVEQSEQVQ